jgi:hypothetical protein
MNIVESNIRDIIVDNREELSKIKFLSDFLDEDVDRVVFIANLIYSKSTLKDAINNLYNSIKPISEYYSNIQNNKLIKSIRTTQNEEEELNDLNEKYNLNKNILAKVAYIKAIVENHKNIQF